MENKELKKSIYWDYDNNTLRGSFINLLMTLLYVILIGCSLVWDRVSKNVAEISSFLLGFYLISFGVWATKKTVEVVKGIKGIIPDKYGDMINQIFEKVSVNGVNDKTGNGGNGK
jgi:hypothetical protein